MPFVSAFQGPGLERPQADCTHPTVALLSYPAPPRPFLLSVKLGCKDPHPRNQWASFYSHNCRFESASDHAVGSSDRIRLRPSALAKYADFSPKLMFRTSLLPQARFFPTMPDFGTHAEVRACDMLHQLRPATNQDAAAVQSLVFGALEEYGLRADPDNTDADLCDIEATYWRAGGRFDVLTDSEGAVLGTVALFRVNPTTCELRKMYLVRAERGKGLGRILLEHAIERAAELGFDRMVLETASALREAVSLYEKRGFHRYNPCHMAARCDAAYYLELSVSKRR